MQQVESVEKDLMGGGTFSHLSPNMYSFED